MMPDCASTTDWAAEGGTYALVMLALRPTRVIAGRLGGFTLPAGYLVYLGSAHGAGGIRGRLSRHLRADKALHWHVDYLRAVLPVVHVVVEVSAVNLECAWTRTLLTLPGASAPVAGFGSSDCHNGCPAHLVHLPADNAISLLGERLISAKSRRGPRLIDLAWESIVWQTEA